MKALVTGATGIVGSNLVRVLLEEGYAVRVLVRPGRDAPSLRRLTVERWTGDVTQPETLVGVAGDCRYVFHCAAAFAYSGIDQAERERLAGEGTRHVVAEAARAGVDRTVVTSSTVVLGRSIDPETRDEHDAQNQNPPNAYVASKVSQDKAALAAAREFGTPVVLACPGLTVGAHDYKLSPSNAALVNYLNDPLRATFPGGGNLVAARDVATGHVCLARRGRDGARYVLGGHNLRWHEVHEAISTLCGTFGPSVRLGHAATVAAGATAESAARLMGRRPSVTRDEAEMACHYYWYRSDAARTLGYRTATLDESLAPALAWLVHRALVNESVLDRLTPAPALLAHLNQLQQVAA